MNRKPLLIASLFFIAVLAGLLFLIFQNHAAPANQKINVVAAENFWGDIARQVGGDKVNVTSIISDPSTDPHLYESSAQNAAAVAQADVIIVNGLGYDDFMSKLIDASPNKNRTVITVADVLGVRSGDNPHLWYNIPRIGDVATAFQHAFSSKNPSEDATFQGNLQTFQTSLQPLLATINNIKNDYPGAPVAYTERIPGYALIAAGLDVKTPATFASAIEDGNEPNPADENAMLDLLTNHQIRVLLYNAQADSPVTEHVRDVAQQNHIPVVPVTETIPQQNKTYQAWQQAQLDAIRAALDNTK